MGAGSANAAAALIGLERELNLALPAETRLTLAAEVGSDVPLFLIGGSVLGHDRGQRVSSAPDITLAGETVIPCVIALPDTGVSTPQAFRDWDVLLAGQSNAKSTPDLHNPQKSSTLEQLSRAYASVFHRSVTSQEVEHSKSGASGIVPKPSSAKALPEQNSPEKQQGLAREQHHTSFPSENTSGFEIDLAENSLLALVRTGIENDFETVVFPQYPLLREIKRHLMGTPLENPALYAALSGSGSALFGLYRSHTDANAAQQRLQQHGVKAIVTSTMPRPLYWSNMFAE
jgi:4-diphosphocytidyl-2-C-methyl-D-erythritol kinase